MVLTLSPHPPNILNRPAPRPRRLGLIPVGADHTFRGSRLYQIFHRKTISPEKANPLAICQLEIHLILPFQASHPKVIVHKAIGELIRRCILAKEMNWRAIRESEESPWP